MPYIKFDSNEAQAQIAASVDAIRGPGRSYYNHSYNLETGADWIGMVEEVLPGETEITAEEFETIRLAHLEVNIPIEVARIDAEIERIKAIPLITNAERRARVQEIEDAIADAENTPEAQQAAIDAVIEKQGPGVTRQEQSAAIGMKNVERINVQGWREMTHTLDEVKEQIAVGALDPANEAMTFQRASKLIGADVLDVVLADALPGQRGPLSREARGAAMLGDIAQDNKPQTVLHETYDDDGNLIDSYEEHVG